MVLFRLLVTVGALRAASMFERLGRCLDAFILEQHQVSLLPCLSGARDHAAYAIRARATVHTDNLAHDGTYLHQVREELFQLRLLEALLVEVGGCLLPGRLEL